MAVKQRRLSAKDRSVYGSLSQRQTRPRDRRIAWHWAFNRSGTGARRRHCCGLLSTRKRGGGQLEGNTSSIHKENLVIQADVADEASVERLVDTVRGHC